MKISRIAAALSVAFILAGSGSAFAGHLKNIKPVNTSGNYIKAPKKSHVTSLGTAKRIGNKSGNVESAEKEKKIEEVDESAKTNTGRSGSGIQDQ
jgi:hypothetical protein